MDVPGRIQREWLGGGRLGVLSTHFCIVPDFHNQATAGSLDRGWAGSTGRELGCVLCLGQSAGLLPASRALPEGGRGREGRREIPATQCTREHLPGAGSTLSTPRACGGEKHEYPKSITQDNSPALVGKDTLQRHRANYHSARKVRCPRIRPQEGGLSTAERAQGLGGRGGWLASEVPTSGTREKTARRHPSSLKEQTGGNILRATLPRVSSCPTSN